MGDVIEFQTKKKLPETAAPPLMYLGCKVSEVEEVTVRVHFNRKPTRDELEVIDQLLDGEAYGACGEEPA